MEDYQSFPKESTQRPGRFRALIVVILAAFLLGIAAAWLIARSVDLPDWDMFRFRQEAPAPLQPNVPLTAIAPVVVPPVPGDEVRRATVAVERVAEQQGGIDQRVAAMEQRLARLDLQSQAAAGNAARAEGLLISFATRRAIERGAPLGYLSDQLRLRFGDSRPNAVRTVIDASQNPITLDQLIARLDGLVAVLVKAPANESAGAWLSRELGELFVVRREDAPSPAANRRLERARMFIESGRTEAAVAEIRHLPNAEEAQSWIADAERYAAAQRALDLLETTAILEPRELRDGSGNRIEQLSPGAPGLGD
ncbi:hypothetical protein GRI97_09650 [Altererythrobacter xixiisoli]|uniref:Inner membrane protein n=1 Tax=Croceibacterium xixiisoli TaxID=1476466 RepID=A0A6I4TTR0_9SPHN|nr:hypothetical protein [Croceibacterium xixiisoli]MXO99252.1 hypothetical protein [Croceibacterium xixiisoli]